MSLGPLQKLSDLTLRIKLALGVIIIIVSLAIFGAYLFKELGTVNRSFANLDIRYDQLKDLLQLDVDSRKLSNSVKFYVLDQDPKWQTTYDAASTDLDSTLADIKKNSKLGVQKMTIHKYETTTNRLKGTELLILAKAQEGNVTGARNLFDLTYETQQSQATDLITNLVTSESANVATMLAHNRQRIKSIQINLTITLVFVVLLLLLLVLLFAADIIASVKALTNAAAQFSKGNFDARVKVRSNDEIGRLGQEFNAMAIEIKHSYNQINQEKARFQSSINSLPIGFIITGPNNEIINMNPAVFNMLGIKDVAMPELTQKLDNNNKLLHTLLERTQKCINQKVSDVMPELVDKGKIFRALMSPVLVKQNGLVSAIGAVIVVEDVTEEKILKRSRDEFFSIASHELRTPLTAIRGNTSMMQLYFPDALKDKELKGMVDDIQNSSVRLIEIVNDFLDVSRLEQDKALFKPEIFDIGEVLESVYYEMGSIIKEKGIYIKAEKTLGILPPVFADKNRVKQIVYNLVGNAMKFTEKGGVTIIPKTEGPLLKIMVSDTGPGISAEGQQLLFHKFQQAGESLYTRDTTRGTGLGLYISKLLVEKMGGQIALENSELDKGTTFSFTIPIATEADKQKTNQPDVDKKSSQDYK